MDTRLVLLKTICQRYITRQERLMVYFAAEYDVGIMYKLMSCGITVCVLYL